MTGRDFIIHILANNLENEPIFKDGTISGFMTISETATKMGVGVATVYTWISLGQIKYIQIGNVFLVPVGCDVISETSNA